MKLRKRFKDGRWVYTARITLRNGRVIWASQYGHKAFRIWVAA